MPDQSFLLKNILIINEGQSFGGDLYLNNGLIEKIFPGGHNGRFNEERCGVIDLSGMLLMPGVIDDQVHFREPGMEYKADIGSESRAAIAGGITSFMEMPNTNPQTTTQELLDKKFRMAAEKSLANYSFYIGATNSNIDELLATDPSHVCGIKVFMGSSTGNMLVDNPIALSAIFRDAKVPVAVHCEDETTIKIRLNAAKNKYGDNIPVYLHPFIRNHEACEKSTRLAMSLASKYNTRLHILHLSTANETRLLENHTALAEKRITAEVCVHHLWFSYDDYRKKGSLIKWNPAIKHEEDRLTLINAIKEGFIDVVATDHAPHTFEEKQMPYTSCPSGAPMVQHALPAMLTLASENDMPYEKIVELMCHNPAICFNIKNRGFIREGYAADLVVIDPSKKTTVKQYNILYKCGWSPMEEYTFNNAVAYTFINGNIVYDNGMINDETKGEALIFQR